MLTDPFASHPALTLRRAFLTSFGMTLVLFGVMRALDAPLRTAAAPQGIVSFELARTPSQATAILSSWEAHPLAVRYAAFGLGIDYLFLCWYAAAFALACAAFGRTFERPGGRALGFLLARLQLLAAALDAVENFSLFQVLLGDVYLTWTQTAWGCAVAKFSLLSAAVLYIVAGSGAYVRRRLAARRPSI